MREVALTQGRVALVDDADFEEVSRYRWYLYTRPKCRTAYAIAHVGHGRKGKRTVWMHQIVMGRGADGQQIDHVNLDGLDNRRGNLRWATAAQQRRNQAVRRDSKSGFKGVYAIGTRWAAYIRINGRNTHLGMFSTPEDAARAHDAKALDIAGDFAWLNFP